MLPETHRYRLLFFVTVLLGFALIVVWRLTYWQVTQAQEMSAKAVQEHSLEQPIPPRRGEIMDARGHLLATNLPAEAVFMSPNQISKKNRAKVVEVLASTLGLPAAEVDAKIGDGQSFYVSVKRRVPLEVTQRLRETIEKEKLLGVYFEPETIRIYPQEALAAQLIGFANYENQGMYGVEGYYNELLRGKPGLLVAEKDTFGGELSIGYRQLTPPEDGASVVLTIDRPVQNFIERTLKKALEDNKAPTGTIIVLDPRTSAIIAMASWPTYDPNKFTTTKPEMMVNPAVSSQYEPGSVFKLVTMSAGLDARAVTPETTLNCKGYVEVNGVLIWTWNKAAHGVENMTQVLQRSCNVGAVFVSQALGRERFYKYVRAFGFGDNSGVDLQGEVPGFVRPYDNDRDWRMIYMANNTFGQGIAVTPLQMLNAAAAIANNGKLMRPHIVERVIKGDQNVYVQPTVVRQVISPSTSATMRDMMVNVVEKEAKGAQVPGYRIAGKTGTAQIPKFGGYEPDQTIVSFIGFAPADDPKFIVLVKIDRPAKSPWAQTVAVPVFNTVARWLLEYYKIPPTQPVPTPTPEG
ncbi:MAG: penicillin-binding protein 2 [Chloroflexi bacterium]|nr:penicillin-binding protein 2 [Chloroflexota bacterium]